MSKLTEAQAVAIVLDPRGVEDVAREHGINRSTVSRIRRGLRNADATADVRAKLARREQLMDEMGHLICKAVGLVEDQIEEWKAEDAAKKDPKP